MLCAEKGATLRVVPMFDNGELDMEAFARLLSPRTRLVAISALSNALGTVTPLAADHPRRARGRSPGAGRRRAGGVSHAGGRAARSTAISSCSPGTSSTGRPASACSTARRALLEAMPPWMGGGDMIATGHLRALHVERDPQQVRGGHARHLRRHRAGRRRGLRQRHRHGSHPGLRAGAARLWHRAPSATWRA